MNCLAWILTYKDSTLMRPATIAREFFRLCNPGSHRSASVTGAVGDGLMDSDGAAAHVANCDWRMNNDRDGWIRWIRIMRIAYCAWPCKSLYSRLAANFLELDSARKEISALDIIGSLATAAAGFATTILHVMEPYNP